MRLPGPLKKGLNPENPGQIKSIHDLRSRADNPRSINMPVPTDTVKRASAQYSLSR